MTNEARFADVVTAVRDLALAEPHWTEFRYPFPQDVASALKLDFSDAGTDYFTRKARDKFYGQVGRALGKLAQAGTLVRTGSRGEQIRYWSPEAYRKDQELRAALDAAAAALSGRKAEIERRIRLLNLPGHRYTSGPDRVTMDLDMTSALLDIAEYVLSRAEES